MRYTGPKFKLCRREGVNLFGPAKYDVRKRRKLPGQHGANMPRLSEYGKLLRNKQTLKRMYMLSEKQFKKIVVNIAQKYAKNNDDTSYDDAVLQFLERRLDSIVYKAGFASTIIQARQMVTHGHFTLNGVRHNVPSTFVSKGDVIAVKEKLQNSPLYQSAPVIVGNYKPPAWVSVQKKAMTITVEDLPHVADVSVPADVLKVIEFYARV